MSQTTSAREPTAAVFTVGYAGIELLGGTAPCHAYPDKLDRDDLSHLIEQVAEQVGPHDSAIVIYPQWSAEPTLRRLQTVRTARADTALAGHGCALPPLAGAVLASYAAALAAEGVTGGALLAGIGRIEAQLLRVTWLSRVSGLVDPSPSVWQHLLSLWPTTAFAVVNQPFPLVKRLTNDDRALDLPRQRERVGVVVADHDGDAGWVEEEVVPALDGPPVQEVAASALAANFWGCRRITEVVTYPLEPAALRAELEAAEVVRPCDWCRQDVAGPSCVFCGHTATSPRAAA